MGGLFNKKKGQTMLYKTNQYYEYMELFKKDDCPVCLIMDEWLDNFLEEFLYECVNDRSMRRRIMETGGFCPKHAKAMMGKGDPLGHSIIYTVLIDDYIKKPDAKKGFCLLMKLTVFLKHWHRPCCSSYSVKHSEISRCRRDGSL